MKRLVVFSAVVAFMLVKAYADHPGEDGDRQFWCAAATSGKIADWKWKLEEEVYVGDDVSDLYHYHAEAGMARSLASWFEMGLNFREIREKKKEEWKKESRPHLNGTVKWSLANWQLSDRNRLEYRMREDADDKWRYRNKLCVIPPLKLWNTGSQPYLADEIYLDLHGDDIIRNRVYAGITARVAKHLGADLSYVWQRSQAEDDWADMHVVRLKVKITF